MKPKISVNVLGYNSREKLNECFVAVLAQDYENFEVLFIDNNSADGSEEYVRHNWPNIKIIQTGKNLGYSGGHNVGIKSTDVDFVVFLNPDVKLSKNYLSSAVEPMLADDKVAGVQGKLLRPSGELQPSNILKNVGGLIDSAGIVIGRTRRARDRGQWEHDNGQYETAQQVFAINGACPVYRKSALLDIAIDGEILDEDFFAYWDDVDLGWRLRHRGWKLFYQPKAVVIHERGSGSSKSGYKKPLEFIKHHSKFSVFTRRLNWKNHIFLIIKNDLGWPFWRNLPFIIFRELSMFIFVIFLEPGTLGILPTFFQQLPKILHKRRIIRKQRTISGFDPMACL